MKRQILLLVASCLAVVSAGCGNSNANVTISSVSPTTLLQSGGTVTITGSNFTQDTTVLFGGLSAVRVNYTSPQIITAVAPPVGTPQQVAVEVSNLEHGSTTLPKALTYESDGITCAGDGSCTYEADSPLNTLSGKATVVPCSGCADGNGVGGIGGGNGNTVQFNSVTVPVMGNYAVTIYGAVSGTGSYSVSVNGTAPMVASLTGSSTTAPVSTTLTMALQPGVNTLLFENANSAAPILDRVAVSGVIVPMPTLSVTYLAAASTNTLSGSAGLNGCTCGGGYEVGSLGWNGTIESSVTINNVEAPTTGKYAVTVYAATAADRDFYITVNGGTPIVLDVPANDSDWSTPGPVYVTLTLQQGTNNTIMLGNPIGWAPNLYSIAVPVTPTP